MKKTILIINTGGTISSIKTKQGYVPTQGHIEAILSATPLLAYSDIPRYVIQEFPHLIDSSNMSIQVWNQLAQQIKDEYEHYDGFVIFHGTDTMAYTASALSFMLENLGKPVILTGSQIPLTVVRSDAIDNVQTSLWLCAHQPINEVCIYFNQKLLRGNRSKKIHDQQFNAFDSPHYPSLATIGIQITLHRERLLPSPTEPLQLQSLQPQYITNFRLFPGFNIEIFKQLVNQPLQALILETYGSGNAPNDDPYFLKLLTDACDRGMIIINQSQCQYGRVLMNQYATGYALKKAGLISGYDMTAECIHCKLLYLFSKYQDHRQIIQQIAMSLRGELTKDRLDTKDH